MRKRDHCCRPVSVCLSVCLSVTLVECFHTTEDIVKRACSERLCYHSHVGRYRKYEENTPEGTDQFADVGIEHITAKSSMHFAV